MKSINVAGIQIFSKISKKILKKAKIIKKKNSIKICKVFVTSLNSELRQCFSSSLAQTFLIYCRGWRVQRLIDVPPQIDLVINTPHFKASDCFSCSFC